MAIEIIRRKDALAQGRKRYFTNKICKHGHIAERRVDNRRCIECTKVVFKKWFSENLDYARARVRRWRAGNYEKVRAREKKRYAENAEKYRAKLKLSRDNNPERTKALRRLHENRRRARKLESAGSYNHEQILDLFKKQKGKCANCFCSIKRGWENDHIISLSKGGSNFISNIQLLCAPCNREKYNKDPIVWAQEKGRLL